MAKVVQLKESDFTAKTIAIRVNRLYHDGISSEELYDITRSFWRVNPNGRARECVYALSVFRGEIKEVYRIYEWKRGDQVELTTRKKVETDNERYAFIGKRVDDPNDPYSSFVGKSIGHLIPHGNQNPIMYFGFDV